MWKAHIVRVKEHVLKGHVRVAGVVQEASDVALAVRVDGEQRLITEVPLEAECLTRSRRTAAKLLPVSRGLIGMTEEDAYITSISDSSSIASAALPDPLALASSGSNCVR